MSDPRITYKVDVQNNTNDNELNKRRWYPSSYAQDLVRQFHEAFDAPVADEPQSIGPIRGFLRADMLKEELDEFEQAVNTDDIVEQYDALLDILVLAYGGLVEMGIDADPGMREVMRANMSKLGEDGKPIISRGIEQDGFPEGKILKGPNYKKPDLFNELVKQKWTPTYKEYLDFYGLKDPREVLEVKPGTPDILDEVIKFVPTENPQPDDEVETKKGTRYNGVNYFHDEPHEYQTQPHNQICICGLPEENAIHVTYIEWDIDRNVPARKDNFRDRVMSGWNPTREEQVAYEEHRYLLEKQYPSAKYVDNELLMMDYRNGEKDVDWDFDTNAPRVNTENN